MNDDRVLFRVDEAKRCAYVTLNRPAVLNAIDDDLPVLLAAAIDKADLDERVRVIVLQGAGKGFCGGYDLKKYAEAPGVIVRMCSRQQGAAVV